MKFTKSDYAGAKAKLAEAGLTERQLAALKDDILRESLEMAEIEACKTRGVTAYEIGGTGSLLHMVGKRDSMQNSLRVAVYWFHKHHNHLLPLRNSRDHAELLETVRTMLETNDEKHLTWCIQQCHDGRLHSPINQENLHLFRRYRNDPVSGSGNAQHMVDEAKEL